MRFCLMIEGQQGVTWKHWLALAESAERLGFEALFRSDHYFSSQGVGGRGSTDAWTLLAALAAKTERIRLGTLVSPVTFRHPSVLAKAAATVDEISSGRVEIGLGAGWWMEEHTQFGFPFPSTRERFEMLEEQLEIVHRLFTEDRFSFEGRHYTLTDAEFLPKGTRDACPPIIVGGKKVGPWMQRLIGAWAAEFNTVGGSPEEVRERFGRARDGVAAAGRPPDSIETSMMTWFFVAPTEDEYLAKLERARSLDPTAGPFDAYRADIEADCIVGTPERAAERLSQYAEAGVQRIMLNHELYDDLEMLELLATEVFPKVEG
ncbi:MAG: TIGR03560 family F420-dependent LLM class oxidoreductase [Actinomycetota bacterium]